MKSIIALVSFLLVSVTGCSDHGAARAAYVRDKSHGCKVIAKIGPQKEWSYTWNKAVVRNNTGTTIYLCKDGVSFHINDDEERP